MKIGIVLGTRPEIIKLSSIIRRCVAKRLDHFIVHTNQHYSDRMDAIFFRELELPAPRHNLRVGSGGHGEMTGRMLIGIEKVLLAERPSVVLVQGDTNTVLAGALAASKLGIPVGHVEAGLRSGDRTMPEEINRIVADHVSDLLFCPTRKQRAILRREDVDARKIHVTGNTVVDAVRECSAIAERRSTVLADLGLEPDGYVLMTAHRPATVDVERRLRAVLRGVDRIAAEGGKAVVFPIHPRTRKQLGKFGVRVPKRFRLVEPVGYLDMLQLQRHASLVVTDSGGIQEEACILRKRCLVTRENTERPEAVEVGGCALVGNADPERIVKTARRLLAKTIRWRNPFGDGESAQRIVGALS
jgi:UDP-N-acetylglucosamine 2-epimerase (non-hydrolysing)